MKRQKWRFPVGQRVVIVPDLGRAGVVVKRSSRKWPPSQTHGYLVKKDRDGVSEWYPDFSLTAECEAGHDAVSAPTEISVSLPGQ